MFRHDHISDDHKAIALARLFENREEAVAGSRGAQFGQPAVAGTRDKVQVIGAVSAMQARRHERLMIQRASFPPLQKTQGRGTHGSLWEGKIEGWATRPTLELDCKLAPIRNCYDKCCL
jgi:hypothetical protein